MPVTTVPRPARCPPARARPELLAIAIHEGNDVQYAYDAEGNVTQKVDPLGAETHLFYDADGFATRKVADATGLALASYLLYDANHRLTGDVDALSQTTVYAYDGFRKTKVTSPGGVVGEFYYNVDGLVTKQVRAAGTSEALTTTPRSCTTFFPKNRNYPHNRQCFAYPSSCARPVPMQ